MIRRIAPALLEAPPGERLDVVGLMQEMADRLIADFGFDPVTLAGEAHLNRTTEPVARFLVWLKRSPEAQAALRFALRQLVEETAHR